MSTAYNRRRGSAANRPRKPRTCREKKCVRIAEVNRYCPDHQRRKNAGQTV